MFRTWFPHAPHATPLTQKVRFRPTVDRLEAHEAPTMFMHPFFVGGGSPIFVTTNINTNVNVNVNVNVNININIVNVTVQTPTPTTPPAPGTQRIEFRIGRVPGRIDIECVDVQTNQVRTRFRIFHEGEPKFRRIDVNKDGATDLVCVFKRNGRVRVRAFSGADGSELTVFAGARSRAAAVSGAAATSGATATSGAVANS